MACPELHPEPRPEPVEGLVEGPVEGRKPRGAFRSRTSKDCYFLDPWRDAVCDRCPLPDCVRPEGAIFVANSRNGSCYKAIRACPIYQAELRGWGPAEAAAHAGELGLLEKVEWGEW